MESNSTVEMEDSFIEPVEEKLDDNEDTDVLPLEMESNSTVEMEDRFIEPAEEKLDDNEDTDVLPLEMESNSTVEREDSFIEQPEEKLDDNLEISAESDESFSNLTIEGSLDNVSALNEQLDIEDSILPDFDTNDDLSLDSEDSELLLEPADQETDLTEFEADINVNRDELPLSAENDFDLVLVPEESQDKEVLEMQETNALTLNANTQNDSNINTNLADYTKFRFEPVNAATLRDDIDADLVIRDLEELSKRNPKLNILDVYSLKYCEGQTITEVASNLQMSEDSVVEALNEILSVI